MQNQFLTNYTDVTFLDKIKDSLRRCSSFSFSVSFIKKAGMFMAMTEDTSGAIKVGIEALKKLIVQDKAKK